MNIESIRYQFTESNIGNRPIAVIRFEKESDIKRLDEFRFSEKNGHFFASDDATGQVMFFYYDRPGTGFGGRTFELVMEDGSVRKLIGPWSSNTGDMNRYFTPSVEVDFEYPSEYIGHAYSRAKGAMTVEALTKLGVPTKQRGEWYEVVNPTTGEFFKP